MTRAGRPEKETKFLIKKGEEGKKQEVSSNS